MTSAPDAVQRGSTLGSYRLFGEVARDALGVLFLACPAGARSFPKWAVVRRMHAGVARDPVMVHAFFAATQASVRMVHRNIATMFDFGGKTTLPWAAREYLLGVSMLDVVAQLTAERARMPWALASYLVSEAAEGVAALRARLPEKGAALGFLTGTVAPSVFITRGGEVKIVDGCMPLIDGVPLIDSAALPYRPILSGREGTRTAAARSDTFGLGVMLWELVAGRRLFAGQTDDETLHLVSTQVVPALRAMTRAPAAIDEIVLRALGASEDGGPPFTGAADLAGALRAALTGQGKRVGSEDVKRTVADMFASVLGDKEASVQRAWVEEQAIQAEGDFPGDPALETELTRPHGDTVRDVNVNADTESVEAMHDDTSDADETEVSLPLAVVRRALAFDELSTVRRNEVTPPQSEPSWRSSAPTEPSLPKPKPMPRATVPLIPVPRIEYVRESPRPPVASAPPARSTTQPVRPVEAEPPPTLRVPREMGLPPIERAETLPRPLPEATRRQAQPQAQVPRASAGAGFGPVASVSATLPSTSSRRAETMIRPRKNASPVFVGGLAFGLSFLAIAVFGVSRRGSSSVDPVGISQPAGISLSTAGDVPPPAQPAARQATHSKDPWTTLPVAGSAKASAIPTATLDALPVASGPGVSPSPAGRPAAAVHGTSPAPPAPPQLGRTGLLTVFCTPACDEVFDGARPLGPSPVFKVQSSVGVHHLRLRVDSKEKKVSVTVTENETAVVREDVGD